jgi:hypothetical protein
LRIKRRTKNAEVRPATNPKIFIAVDSLLFRRCLTESRMFGRNIEGKDVDYQYKDSMKFKLIRSGCKKQI